MISTHHTQCDNTGERNAMAENARTGKIKVLLSTATYDRINAALIGQCGKDLPTLARENPAWAYQLILVVEEQRPMGSDEFMVSVDGGEVADSRVQEPAPTNEPKPAAVGHYDLPDHRVDIEIFVDEPVAFAKVLGLRGGSTQTHVATICYIPQTGVHSY